MDWADSMALRRLAPRALASLIRRLVLPIEILLKDGAYRPFAAAFSRACDAAEPWYALGQDPGRVARLELAAVDTRGSHEEQQMWGTLWSAARAMEFARTGEVESGRQQFRHTLDLIEGWEPRATMGKSSEALVRQVSEYIAHLAETLPVGGDPPLDGDALVVPAFYASEPYSAPAASEAGASRDGTVSDGNALSFDVELSELTRLVKDGRVAVFCGAGISIDSGIPSAIDLRAALLEELPASGREVEWLSEHEIPFEAFLEDLSRYTDLEPLLDMFAEGVPNAGHGFLADLAALGTLQTIATTNFDELIEQGLRAKEVHHRTSWRPEELADSASAKGGVSVVKLHGTASDADSLALVLERVASRQLVPARETAIRQLFADGDHEAVLILGYSCSDVFDISPAIESLGGNHKRVYLVQHASSGSRAEKIHAERRKNPFRGCRDGARLFCHTNCLLEQLSQAILGMALPSSPNVGSDWRSFVQRWWHSVPESERSFVGHSILGLLWYRCGDFRAAKAHYRAALATTAPRFVTPQGDPFYEGLIIERGSASQQVRAQAFLRVGGCHRALSEYRQAMRCYTEAESLAHSCGDQALEAEASGGAGTVLFNQGQFAEAIDRHERSAEIWEGLGRRRELGTCLANLGNAYGASEHLEDALRTFQRGVEIAEEVGDKVGEGSRLGGLGVVHGRLGNWPEAEASHLEALEIAIILNDRSGMAHQYGGLAAVKESRRDLQGAIAYAMKAADAFKELGDRQGEARVLGNLGRYSLASGVVDLAVESQVRSLEMASVIGDASVLENAISSLEQVINLCAKTGAASGDLGRARGLLRLYRQGDTPDGQELEAVFGRLVALLGRRGHGAEE